MFTAQAVQLQNFRIVGDFRGSGRDIASGERRSFKGQAIFHARDGKLSEGWYTLE